MRAIRRIDVRLVIGVVLVIASCVGVALLVASVDRRIPMYQAPEALLPGATITPADLVERRVFLDGGDELYLRPGQLPAEGAVVMRPVHAGELVPLSALSSAEGLSATSLVVTPAVELSSTLRPGAAAEVWAAYEGPGDGVFAPPQVLVSDAIVVALRDDGTFGVGGTSGVELLIPRSRLALVLQAEADGASLAVVPAGMPWAPQ